jgi:hypothetical protein
MKNICNQKIGNKKTLQNLYIFLEFIRKDLEYSYILLNN